MTLIPKRELSSCEIAELFSQLIISREEARALLFTEAPQVAQSVDSENPEVQPQ